MQRVDIFPTNDGQQSYSNFDVTDITKMIEYHSTDSVYVKTVIFAGKTIPVYIHYRKITKQDAEGRLWLILSSSGLPIEK